MDEDDEFFEAAPVSIESSNYNNNNNASLTPKQQQMTIKNQVFKVSIIDATTDVTKINFRVQTTTNLPEFKESTFEVNRPHEEFVWLHHTLTENSAYAGYLIPPCPPDPDFSTSREKYGRYAEVQLQYNKIMVKSSSTTKPGGEIKAPPSSSRTLDKLKKDCEAEYLASFKKCVTSHEQFLSRLVLHDLFRTDANLKIFLECKESLKHHMGSTSTQARNFMTNVFSKAVQLSDEYIFKKMNEKEGVMSERRDSMASSVIGNLPNDDFAKRYSYIKSKLKHIELLRSTSRTVVQKGKNLSNFADWINEAAVSVHQHQRVIENSCKSAVPQLEVLTAVGPQEKSENQKRNQSKWTETDLRLFQKHLSSSNNDMSLLSQSSASTSSSSTANRLHETSQNDLVMSTLLPSIAALHRSMLHETRAQQRLANDYDLQLALMFLTIQNDLKAAKTLIYRRMKVHEKLGKVSDEIQSVQANTYERGRLQQHEADLKNQFEKFNTIGARELEAQSREQETRLPLQFRAHAQMQYKQHIYAAKEIKNLLDKL